MVHHVLSGVQYVNIHWITNSRPYLYKDDIRVTRPFCLTEEQLFFKRAHQKVHHVLSSVQYVYSLDYKLKPIP